MLMLSLTFLASCFEKRKHFHCIVINYPNKTNKTAVPSLREEQGFHKGIKLATTLNTTLFKANIIAEGGGQ